MATSLSTRISTDSSFTPPDEPIYNPDAAMERRIAHRIVGGAIIGFFVMATVVFLMGLWADMGVVPALGVGAFSGVWSGVVSGAAVGGLTVLIRATHGLRDATADPTLVE